MTDGDDRPISGYFVNPIFELTEGHEPCPRNVSLRIFPGLTDVEQKGGLLLIEPLAELQHQHGGDARMATCWKTRPPAHPGILVRVPRHGVGARKLGHHGASNPSA
jgi:hypothetical protein